MARVSITINGNSYEIACADGEEQHILDLAQLLDGRVADLVAAVGRHAGEARLLAMAGLLMADEIAELKDEVARLRAEAEVAQAKLAAAPATSPNRAFDENRLASVLETLAQRIETIAEKASQA